MKLIWWIIAGIIIVFGACVVQAEDLQTQTYLTVGYNAEQDNPYADITIRAKWRLNRDITLSGWTGIRTQVVPLPRNSTTLLQSFSPWESAYSIGLDVWLFNWTVNLGWWHRCTHKVDSNTRWIFKPDVTEYYIRIKL